LITSFADGKISYSDNTESDAPYKYFHLIPFMADIYPRISSVCPRTGSEVEEDGVERVSDAASVVKNFIGSHP
jgi:hypothetical protein